jgi:hypothetical protein
MSFSGRVVLPGDTIAASYLAAYKSKRGLRLGAGLLQDDDLEVTTTRAGALVADHRKGTVWVENNGGKVSRRHVIKGSRLQQLMVVS